MKNGQKFAGKQNNNYKVQPSNLLSQAQLINRKGAVPLINCNWCCQVQLKLKRGGHYNGTEKAYTYLCPLSRIKMNNYIQSFQVYSVTIIMEAKIITIKHTCTLQFRVARHTPSAADLVKIAKNLVKSWLHCTSNIGTTLLICQQSCHQVVTTLSQPGDNLVAGLTGVKSGIHDKKHKSLSQCS